MPPDAADDPATLLSSLLTATETNIVGLMRKSVSEGNLPFAAAIFTTQGLKPLQISVNKVRESPLLHGETNCIREFFALPKEKRPAPDRCVFFATHEPCSLCLSGIAWTGFPIVYYLFSYEDTRDLFGISGDIDILDEVFRVPTAGDARESPIGRPFYNKNNRFFTAKSISELIAEVQDEKERVKWEAEVDRVRILFDEFKKTR